MDRLLARGHGPAVYGYGWQWFKCCLKVADAAETAARKARRLERAGVLLDMVVALRGDQKSIERRFEALMEEK